MKKILKNWKTSAVAVCTVALIGCYIFNVVDKDKLLTIQGLLVAVGFVFSSDAQTPD